VSSAEIKERDAWSAALGIAAIAMSLLVILVAVSNAAGWSPREYTVIIR